LFVAAVVLFLFGADCRSAEQGVYNVVDFGAVGDGKTLNTKAIQAAIDVCTKNAGGTVVLPAGKFVSGTIFIRNNVILLEKDMSIYCPITLNLPPVIMAQASQYYCQIR